MKNLSSFLNFIGHSLETGALYCPFNHFPIIPTAMFQNLSDLGSSSPPRPPPAGKNNKIHSHYFIFWYSVSPDLYQSDTLAQFFNNRWIAVPEPCLVSLVSTPFSSDTNPVSTLTLSLSWSVLSFTICLFHTLHTIFFTRKGTCYPGNSCKAFLPVHP